MICPVCGTKGGACHGSVPVLLTADQLADIGLKPDQLIAGGTIAMADQSEPKSRYPRQEVTKGQKHGYIGEVEVYDPVEQEPGYSNSKVTTTRATAADNAPAEKPVAGLTGTIDNVKAPKS